MIETMQHSGERIHYLSLAMDARLAIKALRQQPQTGSPTAELRDSVRTALDSLKAITRGGGELYAKLGELEPYEHFEQIYTLKEVWSAQNNANFVGELQKIFDGVTLSIEAKSTALKFFSEVERRALHYYSDPSLSERGA